MTLAVWMPVILLGGTVILVLIEELRESRSRVKVSPELIAEIESCFPGQE